MNKKRKNGLIDYELDQLAERWTAPVVARTDKSLQNFAGGALPSQGTMANLDSLGEGPPRFRIGKRTVYPVDTLIKWMKKRQYKEPNQHLDEEGKWAKDPEVEDQQETSYQDTS